LSIDTDNNFTLPARERWTFHMCRWDKAISEPDAPKQNCQKNAVNLCAALASDGTVMGSVCFCGYGTERLTLALRGVSTTFRRFLGVNMVLTLSRPLSMLPNTGVRLLGVSMRCMSLSTDWDLVANRANGQWGASEVGVSRAYAGIFFLLDLFCICLSRNGSSNIKHDKIMYIYYDRTNILV